MKAKFDTTVPRGRTGFWIRSEDDLAVIYYADGYNDYIFNTKAGWKKFGFQSKLGWDMGYDKVSEQEAYEAVQTFGYNEDAFVSPRPWEKNEEISEKFDIHHMSDRVAQAYDIAREAHNGQVDKAGKDYINHPVAVAKGVGNDESAIIVALLHDTVEDTYLTFQDLKDFLKPKEMAALKLLTRPKNMEYTDYLRRMKGNPLAVKVKLSDLNHNGDLSRLSNITEKDLSRKEKYDRAIAFLKS